MMEEEEEEEEEVDYDDSTVVKYMCHDTPTTTGTTNHIETHNLVFFCVDQPASHTCPMCVGCM
jgi:hypothetical protein